MTILTETRERFLLAITAEIPSERIAEIHFFQPIKQAGIESGVAVAAAWPEGMVPAATPAPRVDEPVTVVDAGVDAPANADADADETTQVPSDAASTEEPTPAPAPEAEPTPPRVPVRDVRPVIYTARYRLVLKGIDRGKWETNVFAEADAPLVTVDAVVRGVQRRSGDVDDATRMEGDDVRAFTAARAARTPVR